MEKITKQNITDLGFVGSPTLSPNGKYTAYVVTRSDYKENAYKSCIWLLNNQTKENIQLTYTGKERGFIWNDDSSLLFQARRQKEDEGEPMSPKSVFYLLPLTGGEAHKAFEVDKNVIGIKKIGLDKYVLTVEEDLNAPSPDTDKTLLEDEKDYHVLEELPFYANGAGFISRTRAALYIYDAEANTTSKITDTYFNTQGYDVKDGKIVYWGQEYVNKAEFYDSVSLYDIESGTTQKIIKDNTYMVGYAAFISNYILLAMTEGKSFGFEEYKSFYLYNPQNGELKLIASPQLCMAAYLTTDAMFGRAGQRKTVGDKLWFLGMETYKTALYTLSLDGSVNKVAEFNKTLLGFDKNEFNTVFMAAGASETCELYLEDNSALQKVTHVNDEFFKDKLVSLPEPISFENSDGVTIYGFVLKPVDYAPNKKYPAVLEIHGGPRGAYGDIFVHEMQALCGEGYFVFFCNPRGSEGQGQEFADIKGKWGDVDYKDLMEFTDVVLKKYPAIDPSRVGETGGSYGGFMSNWIVGHTDRFAAIVSQRSISNWIADWGTSEIGYTFDGAETTATPWTNVQKMWDMSPLKYADKAKTPILFIHSMCDYNCPLDQGIEMFTAMKYFGVPSRMCLFEGENHNLSRSGKPRHRVRRLTEMFNWFEKYLKSN